MPPTTFEVAGLDETFVLCSPGLLRAYIQQASGEESVLLLQGHPVLQHEYNRVKAGKPLEPLDTSRFHLEPPPASKQNDFSAWRKATDNAHSQLEHQYNRLTAVLC